MTKDKTPTPTPTLARDVRIGDTILTSRGPAKVTRKQMNRRDWNNVTLYLSNGGGSTTLRRDTELTILK